MVVVEGTPGRLAGVGDDETFGYARGEFVAEARTLLRLAAPITLSQLAAMGMTTMDTIMVGPLGPEALAAIGLAGSLHFAVLVITTGTLFGMSPLVSQAYGAGDRRTCQKVLVQGLWVALLLSLPVFAINSLGEPIALALGQDAEVARIVGGYMAALAWGVPPLLAYFALRQYLEGMGLTRPAMVITFVGLACNFAANHVFIYGYGGFVEPMGAVGSGWATSMVRWAMLSAMLAYVLSRRELRPSVGARFDARTLRMIVYVGLPTGVQIGLETGFFAFTAVMMGWFGAAELATHQVTINLAATTFMIALGVSMAGSIRVGQTIGSGDPHRTRIVVVITYLFAALSMAICALVFLAIPEPLLRLYTEDSAVVALGASLLFVAALFQVFDGVQVAGFSVLRGAADTRVPMFIAAAAYWVVGAPVAYFLGFRTALGPVGVWTGMVVGLAVAAVMLTGRVWVIHWRGAPVRVVG